MNVTRFNRSHTRDTERLSQQVAALTAANAKYQAIVEKGYDELKDRDASSVSAIRK